MIIVRTIGFNFYIGIQNFCLGKTNFVHCLLSNVLNAGFLTLPVTYIVSKILE